ALDSLGFAFSGYVLARLNRPWAMLDWSSLIGWSFSLRDSSMCSISWRYITHALFAFLPR
ncbi:MAG: hypothetical protein ACKOAH_28220, partial [Pirellula sp.]